VPTVAKEAVPAGRLQVATSGSGPKEIDISSLSSGSSRVTVKLSCQGDGTAAITDQTGASVLDVGGCTGRAIYTTGFDSTSADQVLRLNLGPAVSWQIAIWA